MARIYELYERDGVRVHRIATITFTSEDDFSVLVHTDNMSKEAFVDSLTMLTSNPDNRREVEKSCS